MSSELVVEGSVSGKLSRGSFEWSSTEEVWQLRFSSWSSAFEARRLLGRTRLLQFLAPVDVEISIAGRRLPRLHLNAAQHFGLAVGGSKIGLSFFRKGGAQCFH